MSILFAVLATVVSQGNWPGFLGAGADARDMGQLPLQWTPTENIAWSMTTPGYGQSSPVIWQQRVFVTAVEGANKDVNRVLCAELATGRELWQYSLPTSDPVKNSLYVSRAAPTPVVDTDRVMAFFESGDLVALSHQGKQLWKRSLSQDYGRFQNEFGLGASPLQTSDRVVVLVDDTGKSYLVAIDKRDGHTLWKRDRTPRKSWSSPTLLVLNGVPQIVVSSDGTVDGYDVASGELLWTLAEVGGNTGASPLGFSENRFLIAASPGRQGEYAASARRSNGAVRVTKADQAWAVERCWNTQEATPTWASPIVYQGWRTGSTRWEWSIASMPRPASCIFGNESNSPAGPRRWVRATASTSSARTA